MSTRYPDPPVTALVGVICSPMLVALSGIVVAGADMYCQVEVIVVAVPAVPAAICCPSELKNTSLACSPPVYPDQVFTAASPVTCVPAPGAMGARVVVKVPKLSFAATVPAPPAFARTSMALVLPLPAPGADPTEKRVVLSVSDPVAVSWFGFCGSQCPAVVPVCSMIPSNHPCPDVLVVISCAFMFFASRGA